MTQRPIKFRAWDRQKDEWAYFTVFDSPDWLVLDKKTVNEFTGLLDKNGEEIYEGDVILCQYIGMSRERRQEEVRWELGRFLPDIARLDSTEVIGNIHENPELVKVA